MASREVNLLVNDVPIPIDYFIQNFIDHVVSGMLASLEGTGEIKSLDISIEGEEVTINLNDALVPVNFFVSKIIRSTTSGMVSTLKGVNGINKINISIRS